MIVSQAEPSSALVDWSLRFCSRCRSPIPKDNFLDMCPACEVKYANEKPPTYCELCRGDLPEGRTVCDECLTKVPTTERQPIAFDLETELITDECPIPPIVCAQFSNVSDYWLFHHTEARGPIEAALRSDALLIGHYVAFDMAAVCYQWPDLGPLVFKAYEDDRVTDTMLREKLCDIALGMYFDGVEYPLEKVVRKHCGIQLEKGTRQLRFGELKHLPVEQWPEEARHYAIADVVTTLAVYRAQEKSRHWLSDQYRQARASFVLELMSAYGLHTDETAVREYKQQLETKFSTLAEEMVANGLMRRISTKKKATQTVETKLVRTMTAVKERVVRAYLSAGKKAPRTSPSRQHLEGQVCTDADTCIYSGDEVLKHYADLSSTGTLLSTFVPLLERGVHTPLHTRFTSLLSTGRTSSSPNVQNLPTEKGVRECFAPRPGYVYIVSDYAGIELRTWAQICWSLFKHSKMREALNAGIDPHTLLASKIMGIPYEMAVADYARDKKGAVYFPRQAAKAANFGFPGGAGYKRWKEYARSNYNVDIPEDDPKAPIDAKRVKKFWRETWDEAGLYADWCSTQCDAGPGGLGTVEQAVVGRFRGGLRYPEFANSLFQGLASDLFKAALFGVTKACYVEPASVLFGSRPVNEIHDEIVTETPDNEHAHEAAMEQEHLMIEAARPFLPDITNIDAETALCRRWSKAAKVVKDTNGRLIPWELT